MLNLPTVTRLPACLPACLPANLITTPPQSFFELKNEDAAPKLTFTFPAPGYLEGVKVRAVREPLEPLESR